MKLNYDNLEDAKAKLQSTYCYYKGKPLTVKMVDYADPVDPTKYMITGQFMETGRNFSCFLDDPEFNCSDYNIGYINSGPGRAAAWFYRLPGKQYKQGLRYDQVDICISKNEYSGVKFTVGKALAAMLRNEYPKPKEAADLLQKGDAVILAFHKNFAMSYDSLHKDYILEYKGKIIGFSADLKVFTLLDEYKHLLESLKEAVNQ